MKTVLCDRCNQLAVHLRNTTDAEVQFWKCDGCGEVRAWCPYCNQGWVRHVGLIHNQTDCYVCDECDAAWLDKADIGTSKGYTLQDIAGRVIVDWASEMRIIKDED